MSEPEPSDLENTLAWAVLAIIGAVCLVYLGVLLVGPATPRADQIAAPLAAASVVAESSPAPPAQGNLPPWAKMAVIDAGGQPAAEDLRRFEQAFAVIAAVCPDSPERLGDFLVAGHAQLRDEKGLRISLLTLTESVSQVVEPLARDGVRQRVSCSDVIALLVTMITSD